MLVKGNVLPPIVTIPAGEGSGTAFAWTRTPVVRDLPAEAHEDFFGPAVTHVRTRAELTVLMMVAALAALTDLTADELADPAEVRSEIDALVMFHGWGRVYEAVNTLAEIEASDPGWVLACRQAVAEMLTAETTAAGTVR